MGASSPRDSSSGTPGSASDDDAPRGGSPDGERSADSWSIRLVLALLPQLHSVPTSLSRGEASPLPQVVPRAAPRISFGPAPIPSPFGAPFLALAPSGRAAVWGRPRSSTGWNTLSWPGSSPQSPLDGLGQFLATLRHSSRCGGEAAQRWLPAQPAVTNELLVLPEAVLRCSCLLVFLMSVAKITVEGRGEQNGDWFSELFSKIVFSVPSRSLSIHHFLAVFCLLMSWPFIVYLNATYTIHLKRIST